MTRTISLITATVGAALLFAVPAYGDNWGADQRSQPVGYLSPDSGDRAAALQQQKVTDMLDAREASQSATIAPTPTPDWFERAANAAIRDNRGVVVVDDRFDLHPKDISATVTATSSGREFDFPKIGIGVALGLMLVLGLYFAIRGPRLGRPLAH